MPSSSWSLSREALRESVHRENTWTATSTRGPGYRDKLVQQAWVPSQQIYEEDFLGFSYGFARGATSIKHWMRWSYGLLTKKVNYVLDAISEDFSDNLRQELLIQFVEHRVADPRILG